jgi:hypothetical protein
VRARTFGIEMGYHNFFRPSSQFPLHLDFITLVISQCDEEYIVGRIPTFVDVSCVVSHFARRIEVGFLFR